MVQRMLYKLEFKDGDIISISDKKKFTIIEMEKTHMKMDIGYCRKILSILEKNNVDFTIISSGVDSISLVIDNSELNNNLHKILEEIEYQCSPDSIITYANMTLIAVVYEGMIKAQVMCAKIFSALSKYDININMINQGSSQLSIIIGEENQDFKNAINEYIKSLNINNHLGCCNNEF